MASTAVAFLVFGHLLTTASRRYLLELLLPSHTDNGEPCQKPPPTNNNNAGATSSSKILTPDPPAIASGPPKPDDIDRWHPHGLPANLTVQLPRLSGKKRYKISNVNLFDRHLHNQQLPVDKNDPIAEMISLSLRPGDICMKSHLQAELESLASSSMFEKIDMSAKSNPDGTIDLNVSFSESTWRRPNKVRCISVGLLPPPKTMEEALDKDATDGEKLRFLKREEREYKKRVERARRCLLPEEVAREVAGMLRMERLVSARTIRRANDRIESWYHEAGYASARVLNFSNLNGKVMVVEVDEGDVTAIEVKFQDSVGNVVEGNTKIEVIKRELPKQVNFSVFNLFSR